MGERDLSTLPCLGGTAVHISLEIGECCVARVISSRVSHIGEDFYYLTFMLGRVTDGRWRMVDYKFYFYGTW